MSKCYMCEIGNKKGGCELGNCEKMSKLLKDELFPPSQQPEVIKAKASEWTKERHDKFKEYAESHRNWLDNDYFGDSAVRTDDVLDCLNEIERLQSEVAELRSQLDGAVFIRYENEDELPEIDDNIYRAMFNCSRVDFVRLFPYIEIEGKKCFLVSFTGVNA